MAEKLSPERQSDRVEESSSTPGDELPPMDKFKTLAKGLVKISRGQLEDEQAKYKFGRTSSTRTSNGRIASNE